MGVQRSCCLRQSSELEQEIMLMADLQRGAADPSKLKARDGTFKSEPGRKKVLSIEDIQPETHIKIDNAKSDKILSTKAGPEPQPESSYFVVEQLTKQASKGQPKETVTGQSREVCMEQKHVPKSFSEILGLPTWAKPLKELPPITNYRVKEMVGKVCDLPLPEGIESKYKSPAYRRLGPVLLPSAEVYVGQWKENSIEGVGIKMFKDGSMYRGEFSDGLQHGFGVFINADGDIYQGQWSKAKPHGTGEYLKFNGSFYSGGWNNGKKEGESREYWPDGTVYKGEYKADKFDGKGSMVWPSNCTYAGHFKNGLMEGQGTYTWLDGKKYTGAWLNNKMHGHGVITWGDGRRYEGEWQNGKRAGKGTYLQPSRSQIKAQNGKDDILEFQGIFGNSRFQGSLVKGNKKKDIVWERGLFKKATSKDMIELAKFELAQP